MQLLQHGGYISTLITFSLLFLLKTCSCHLTSQYNDSEIFQSTFTKNHLEILRNETRGLFNHAWDSYMEFGFPFDEVNPLICQPNKPDFNDLNNKVKNDVMGNFSLTLFDSIDTFVIMGDKPAFEKYVQLIKDTYSDFDIDSNVQVFETTIRILGGLLSSHLYASDPRKGFSIEGYDGFLLRLAYDLGKRLILAYDNDINIPYPRTNLRKGPNKLSANLQIEQCTAGITSLILEFSLLGRLTNDPIFEYVTRNSFLNMWASRTSLDLLPMSVDAKTKMFSDQVTGIGASIDSFYEYALKYSILFDDSTLYDVWYRSYKSLLTHSQNYFGIFTNVHVSNGVSVTEWIDSLGAFFPGLLSLAGDIKNSMNLHITFLKLWNYYGVIPERWNFSGYRSEKLLLKDETYKNGDKLSGLSLEQTNEALLKNSIGLEWFPLRPEFIESTYHLYRATKDPIYLRIGESILKDFKERFAAPCGFAGILDIITNRRQDRMESFVLSETLKYLYLLFDEDNDIHTKKNGAGNLIFSTEAHPFWFDKSLAIYDLVKEDQEADLAGKLQSEEHDGIVATTVGSGFIDYYYDKFFGDDYEKQLNRYARLPYEKLARYVLRDVKFGELKSKILKDLQNHTRWVSVPTSDELVSLLKKFHLMSNDMVVTNDRLSLDEKIFSTYITPLVDIPKTVMSLDVIGLTLTKDYLCLNECQAPGINSANSFLNSKLLHNPELYLIDEAYQLSLRRPNYRINEVEMELGSPFYEIFGSVNVNGLICSKPHDTQIFEAMVGDIAKVSHSKVYRIKTKNGKSMKNWTSEQLHLIKSHQTTEQNEPEESLQITGVLPGDLFIRDCTNLRMTFEKLEVGKMDSFGDFITEDYIKRFATTKNHENLEESNDSILRVLKLNGVKLGFNEVIWVSLEWFRKEDTQSSVWFNDFGMVTLNNEVVENMRVLIEEVEE
ncbi:glycoside hydrolase family 47 protein [[Candida] arabinofermentans NRRL YB-2248]|uniref:alpha-1,2-Mannosidase n=1 Tax=[Candida] arabinofermentans NRRL YB-2248 TaxID=983967 RepID=A0A1E4T8M2_9ASCO|nr:glycoside hydrolase family 47 protein [[Candida] arabinofermentans NRRL YB-2248]